MVSWLSYLYNGNSYTGKQCLKLSQKSCRSPCLESQIINIKLKQKGTKSSRSSSKVVGLGPADLWEFPTLLVRHLYIEPSPRMPFVIETTGHQEPQYGPIWEEKWVILVLQLINDWGQIWFIPWLLMHWLLVSPDHQWPWYWLISWSSMKEDFNTRCCEIIENTNLHCFLA